MDTRPCSNSLLWAACGLSEALNGLSGKRLGANKKQPSPKHRSAACKARLVESFRVVLSALAQAQLLPDPLVPLLTPGLLEAQSGVTSSTPFTTSTTSTTAAPDPPPPTSLTYAELKGLATDYQRRKAAFLHRPRLCDWVRAPAACEAFDTGLLCRPCE